ncbi:MAG TPA: S4 domain-containing protein [Capillimicrobium sp.]|nr:S4 domain-containing protein [Capillimicrobium sp.]
MDDAPEPLRADTWLWTARLAKTRALAVEAIKGGKVAVNGARIKPSRTIKPGDRIELTTGPTKLEVIVKGSAKRRLPASEAVLLYDETPESVAAREAYVAQRRLAAEPQFERGGRPTKRDRRRIEEALGKQRRGRRAR